MEPKIIKGHIYKCKENCDKAYTKGRVYECEYEVFDGNNYSKEDIYGCGFITNNDGNEGHAWPYHPKEHPWTKEKPEENRWTRYFEDMGEKPHGVIISPYEVRRPNWHHLHNYMDNEAQPFCKVSNPNNVTRWARLMIDAGRVTDIYADCY